VTTQQIEPARPAPVPVRIGQSTAVEQSRAVAEVQAAVTVAQQFPRNIADAIAAVRESCRQRSLAERAFFRFPRAGGAVTGETIHLARELARIWGNLDYGIKELSRDDELGESEMQAYAWDMQTNTRVENGFLVPHARDRQGGGRDKLASLRDIYENNANMGSRRVRECIFAVLPPWLIEEAKDLCAATLRGDGSGKTLQQRCADAIGLFAGLGVTDDQIEQKLNRPVDRWTEFDLAQLSVIYRSIQRGEITRDEEFPPRRVTTDEIEANAAAAGVTPVTVEEPWPDVPPIGGADHG